MDSANRAHIGDFQAGEPDTAKLCRRWHSTLREPASIVNAQLQASSQLRLALQVVSPRPA